MKWFVIEIARWLVVASLLLAAFCMTLFACRMASSETHKKEYPPIVYALDVDLEEATDVPSVNEMAYWLSRTNATASGGWVPVGGKEAAP